MDAGMLFHASVFLQSVVCGILDPLRERGCDHLPIRGRIWGRRSETHLVEGLHGPLRHDPSLYQTQRRVVCGGISPPFFTCPRHNDGAAGPRQNESNS